VTTLKATTHGGTGESAGPLSTSSADRDLESSGSAVRRVVHANDETASRGQSDLPETRVQSGWTSGPADDEIGWGDLSRSRRVAYVVVFAGLALNVLGFALVHLHHTTTAPANALSSSASKTTRTTTSTASRSTTTTSLPLALKPNAETAATALVQAWATGNRLAALTVATPAAASALFSNPYSSGQAIDRGCSTSFSPIICTFGPPGGASPTDPIYQISVTQAPGGWYVSSIKTEN